MRPPAPRDGFRNAEYVRRWAAICSMAVCAFGLGFSAGGCNPTAGGGGSGAADDQAGQNDNADQPGQPDGDPSNGNEDESVEAGQREQIDVEFDTDPVGGLFARVQGADGIEFAVFVQRDPDGTMPEGRPANAVNTHFEDGTLTKSALDSEGRPVNIVTPGFSAGIVYRSGSGGRNRMLLVDADGDDTVVDLDIDETVTGLQDSETAESDPRLCARVARYVAMLEQIVKGCSDGDRSPRCRDAFRRLASASRVLCTAEVRETEVEVSAEAVGLSAGAQCSVLESAPGVADLDGQAAGGTPPYEYAWELIRAAPSSYSEIESADQQFARLVLEAFGEYLIGLTVTDADDSQAAAICLVEREVTEAEEFTLDIVIQTGFDDETGTVAAGSTLTLAGFFRVEVTEDVAYTWSILPQTAGTFDPPTVDANPIFLILSEDSTGDLIIKLEAVRLSDGRTTQATLLVPIAASPDECAAAGQVCSIHGDCCAGLVCGGAGVCAELAPGCNPACGDGFECVDGECVAVTECQTGADCDDGLFCNGVEACSAGECQAGSPPCPEGETCDEGTQACLECGDDSDCDDGLFCNGTETCDGAACQAGAPPCTAGEQCDEDTDVCVSGSFTERIISTSATNVHSVFAADVDGDGAVDVLSASTTIDRIAWHENAGGPVPSFTERTISTSADGAWCVFAADLDGDGDTDVLSASYNDDKIAWYENDGGSPPGFTERVLSTTATKARSVFAADLDGDGDIDVLSASPSNDTVAWYENDGGLPPGFTERTVSTAADGPWSVYAADLDGDGDVDVLSASANDDKIAWHQNDGALTPGFAERVISTTADSAVSVFAADLDGDGDVDVLSASKDDAKIAWYQNDGASTPGFTERVISTTADHARSVLAADIDGDGNTDVLSASAFDDKIAWYQNSGGMSPTFTEQIISTAADGAWCVFAADLDGDGTSDVLSASYEDDKVAWYQR